MPDRIPFPTSPDDGDFYTDGNDLRWQYSEFKRRWSLTPLAALTSAYTTSETPPDDHELQWFDPTSGTLSIWSESDDAWIAVSGPGNDGEDGADLTEVIPVTEITIEEHTFVTANISDYLYFTFVGAKTALLPVTSGTFAPVVGDLLTVRNDSTGDITITPTGGVPPVIKYFAGGLTVAQDTTAQLIYMGDQEWHLL